MNDLAILTDAKNAVIKAKTVVEVNRLIKVAEAVKAVAETEETYPTNAGYVQPGSLERQDERPSPGNRGGSDGATVRARPRAEF